MPNVVSLPPRLSPHFPDLTTGALNGKGLFDLLMGATKEHLMEEFNAQRLRGTDYSKVYLGSMESALGNSVQYLIGMGLIDAQLEKLAAETALAKFQLEKEKQLLPLEIEKVHADIDLTKAKIDSETTLLPLQVKKLEADTRATEAQIRGTEAQIRLTEEQIKREKELLPLQKSQITAEVARTEAQTEQISEQIKLIPYEIQKIEADIKATDAQILKLEKDKELTTQQIAELKYRVTQMLPEERTTIIAQREKIHQEKELIQHQVHIEIKRLLVMDAEISTATAQATQLGAQTAKINEEKALVNAKTAESTKNLSVLDKQIILLQEQAAAYDKEIAVKRDKIQADSWSAKAVADGSGAGGPPSWT